MKLYLLVVANLVTFTNVLADRPEHLVSACYEILDDGTNDVCEFKGDTCFGASKLLNEFCYVKYSDGLTTYDFVGVRNKYFILDQTDEFNCTAITKDESSWMVTRKATNQFVWWGPKRGEWTPTVLYVTPCVFRENGRIYFGADIGKCCDYRHLGFMTCDWWRV